MFSRRQFLRIAGYGGAALAGELASGIGDGGLDIPFEYARAFPETRPAYVEQQVMSVIGPSAYNHATRFAYDHDFSLTLPAEHARNEKLFQDPREMVRFKKLLQKPGGLQRMSREYDNDPRFFLFDGGDRESRIREFILSEEGAKDVIRKAMEESERLSKEGWKYTAGVCVSNNLDMGKRIKSEIFIGRNSFDPSRITTPGGEKIAIEPSEVRVNSAIVHEYGHARDNYKGIVVIIPPQIFAMNYRNILDIEPALAHGITETRCQRDGWAYTRRHKSPVDPGCKFHSAFVESTIEFDFNLRRFAQLGDIGLDPYSKRIWEIQMKEFMPLIPETRSVVAAVGFA
jgi:hypothetical protein